MRLAVFASGYGSNLEAIAKEVPVSLVFSDHSDSRAMSLVPDAEHVSFSPADFSSRAEYEQALATMVADHQIDLVALAGYMRIVGAPLLDALPERILNIHPSLLPNFPGKDAIGQAFRAGAANSGVTVHLVDAGIDTGPIIAQVEVPMVATLAELEERIHEAEHALYPAVIKKMMEEAP